MLCMHACAHRGCEGPLQLCVVNLKPPCICHLYLPIHTHTHTHVYTHQALTPTPFLLSAQSLTEFPVTLRTLSPGKSTLLVSAVGVDGKTAVQRWMVCSESHPPPISRGFQISLPTGGGALIKKVHVTVTVAVLRLNNIVYSVNR